MGKRNYGEPPEDGRKWIRAEEAAALLGLGMRYFCHLARERELTVFRAWRTAPGWHLRSEIDSWADRRQLRRRWCRKYTLSGHYPRTVEQMDVETAREIFITSNAVAAMLGVSLQRVHDLVKKGHLVSYQSKPGHRGSRFWFSRRSVAQLMAEPKRQEALKRRAEGHRKVRPQRAKGYSARDLRGVKIPEGWLTTREVAERLGVSVSMVDSLRKRGRLRGERIWRRNNWLRYWYIPVWEVERMETEEGYLKLRAEYRARQEAKKAVDVTKILVGNNLVKEVFSMLHSRMRPVWADERPRSRPIYADEMGYSL